MDFVAGNWLWWLIVGFVCVMSAVLLHVREMGVLMNSPANNPSRIFQRFALVAFLLLAGVTNFILFAISVLVILIDRVK